LVCVHDLLSRLQKALGNRYGIEREIGRGGMAIVYLAQDLKHRRRVAIKVLRPDLVPTLGPDRFLREIEIAARLTHPNILPLHDSGEAGELLYYVMPYVEGETLRGRLQREQQLPLDEAVQIAHEVADALGYAHSLGLIHRDIKPENILFQAGHALVSDFGIARAVSPVTRTAGAQMTASGIALGTLAYMSPEQIAGKKDLDSRTDLYSLGGVLYEMLAGEVPLGPSTSTLPTEGPAAEIRAARESVSLPLAGVIARALARAPADRFATAAQFQDALRAASVPRTAEPVAPSDRAKRGWPKRLAGATGVLALVVAVGWYAVGRSSPLDVHRVAVAPLEDRTGETRLAQLGELAADWITRGISRSGAFDVIAATVARDAWTAADATPGGQVRTLAERTGAAVIVSGAYSLDGPLVRFDADIVDARTGRLVTDIEPVTAAGDSAMRAVALLAERVTGALVARLGPEPVGTLVSNPPSLEAFRQYRLGLEVFSRGEWDQSIVHFKRAIAIDSTYPPPVVWAATAYNNLARPGAADTMLMTIGSLVDRLMPLERVNYEWQAAVARGDRAGQLRWAEEGYRLARSWAYPFGLNLVRSNRPRQALEVLSRYPRDTPFARNWAPYWERSGEAHHLLGEYRRELRLVGQWRGTNPPQLRDLQVEVRALAALGRRADVERLLELSLSLPAQGQGRARVSPTLLALVAAQEFRAHGYRTASHAALDRVIARIRSGALGDTEPYTLGRAVYLKERWTEARAVFDPLAHARPENVDYLGFLGATYARLGEHERAAAVDSQLARVNQRDIRGLNTRWRAQIAALLGDRELAMRLLRQAADDGIPLGIELHADIDFETLLDYPPFQAFIKPKG
jgi:tRNA A-37 threonylcarbamoyl transferase component Bud32/tetratricopeptide (TPR) repeat protein/TolB-like protein